MYEIILYYRACFWFDCSFIFADFLMNFKTSNLKKEVYDYLTLFKNAFIKCGSFIHCFSLENPALSVFMFVDFLKMYNQSM